MSLAKKIAKSLPAGAGNPRPFILSAERKTREPRTKNPKAKPPGGRGGIMAYRSLDENFWRSPKVRALTDQGKLAYAFLITQGRLTGIIYRPPEELAAAIGWTLEKWELTLKELLNANRVSIGYPNLIWVKNHIDHQFLAGGKAISPQQIKGMYRELRELPQGAITQAIKKKYPEVFKYPTDRVLGEKSNSDRESISFKAKTKELKDGRREAPTSNFKLFTAWYFEEWERRFKAKPNWNGVDGKNLKGLLTRFGLEDIKAHCLEYFNNPDWHSQQNGQSFRNFCAVYDKITTRMTSAEWQPAKERQYDPQ